VFAEAGLIPRNRIVWTFGHGLHCKNRFSGRHETILWFTKGKNYTFNLDAVRIPSKYPMKKHFKGDKKGQLSGNPLGKNPEDVWPISNVKHNHPEKTAHPCQFPVAICDRLVKSLSHRGDIILDPFLGSGTTGVACANTGRRFIGIERDETYFQIAQDRIAAAQPASVMPTPDNDNELRVMSPWERLIRSVING
jgi:adenine-specific DNA-methyltransferase